MATWKTVGESTGILRNVVAVTMELQVNWIGTALYVRVQLSLNYWMCQQGHLHLWYCWLYLVHHLFFYHSIKVKCVNYKNRPEYVYLCEFVLVYLCYSVILWVVHLCKLITLCVHYILKFTMPTVADVRFTNICRVSYIITTHIRYSHLFQF